MGEAIMQRRSVLTALVGLVAAPAIIKVAGIMPVNAALQPRGVGWNYNVHTGLWTEIVSYEAVVPQASVDVLYGSMKVGDIVTWEAEPQGPLRQFVIVADGTGSLPKGSHHVVTDEERRRFWPLRDDEIGGGSNPLLADNEFVTSDARNGWQWSETQIAKMKVRLEREAAPEISAPEVAALGVAAVLAKNPTVSRRFWSR